MINMARYLEFQNFQQRVNSFSDKFPIKGITSIEFAEAGFYSIGIQDYTRCFYCGIGLRGWDNTDIPWKQHAKFSSSCKYLLDKKGEEFVKSQQIFKRDMDKDSAIEEKERINLTENEIDLFVKSRMAEKKIRMVLNYQLKLSFDEESIKEAIESRFRNKNDDFKSIEELIRQAHLIFKEKKCNNLIYKQSS